MATLVATSAQADTPAFSLGTVLPDQPLSSPSTRGWQFGRGGTPNSILVTQLGVFDSGGDGLVNAHQIGLWHADPGNLTGTLLASATVPAGTEAPLIGGYRWVSVSPVPLPFSLQPYNVGALFSALDADNLVAPQASQFAPDINPFMGAGKAATGPELAFPAGFSLPPCPGCGTPLYLEANFQYTVVPEPSVWFLLPPALGLLFLRHRKSARP